MLDSTRAVVDRLKARLQRLQEIEPYLIDLSLRENPVGARVGQTLQDKLNLLPRIREFGFKNILLGTLDYSMPEELEVDDDFMMYLRDHHIDMTGGFAFTDIGLVAPDGSFKPSWSMKKLKDYGVPNTLHEIYLSPEGMQEAKYDFATLMRSLPVTIEWLRANIRGDGGGPPRILINIVDGCDAFAENLDQTCQVLELLAKQPIEGVSFEDDRGTYMPFQVGGYVAIARSYLPPPLKLLVHMHAGGGFENASLIEALLEGADGVWGGLPKRAAIIGHASLGELIANLVRAGNQNMHKYQLGNLLPLATGMQILDEQERVPDDLPILGSSAYRLTLEFFRQKPGRFMDLPPEAIGGTYGYRICPVVSDPPVIRGRLAQVTGQPADSFDKNVIDQMIRLMRRSLREGNRVAWDEPKALLFLYEQAGGTPP
ncbi:MAG: homocitrate synthase [Kofleriaceae bacterium]|nr:homocitrate synthase [Kofleriaceae bacterium]